MAGQVTKWKMSEIADTLIDFFCYSGSVKKRTNHRIPRNARERMASGRMGKIRDTFIDFLCYSGSVADGTEICTV